MSPVSQPPDDDAGMLGRGRPPLGWLIGAVVAACAFLPFFVSGVFPSQDGPAHLHTASLLALIREGQAPVAASMLMEVEPGLTNKASYWVLSLLLGILPAPWAEWAMALGLTGLLLGSVLASVRLLGGRAADAVPGVLLCMPFALYMGSFALVMAMAPAFLSLAFAARLLRSGSAVDAAAASAIGLLSCALQIQAAVPILAAILGGTVGVMAWRYTRGGGLAIPQPARLMLLAALPVLVAAFAFNLGAAPVPHAGESPIWNPLRQGGILVLRRDVAAFSLFGTLVLGAVTLALGAAAAASLLRESRSDGATAEKPEALQRSWLLAAALAVGGAALALPVETAGVPHITHRIAPFAHFLLLLWFGVAPLSARWRTAVVGLAVLAALSIAVFRTRGHTLLDRTIAELAWAESQLPARGLVAFASLPEALMRRAPTMQQAGAVIEATGHLGRGLKGRDVVSLSNYQLMPIWRIFRLTFRPDVADQLPELNEFHIMLRQGKLHGGLGAFRENLRRATGQELDVIVIWNGGLEPGAADAIPAVAAFLSDLRSQYERIAVSQPGGYAEIWRLR